MSPERVPMGRPASGVKPMEVSTLLPPSMAVTEEPLPRWQEISLSCSMGLAQHIGRALGNILVRGAVEAVAADLVLLIVLIGNGIQCRPWRAWSGGRRCRTRPPWGTSWPMTRLAGLDADDVGGVVERREGIALLHCLHDLVGDDERSLAKLLAAVDHAVAHSVDLLHGADDAVVLVHQRVQHGLDGLGVGGHGDVKRPLTASLPSTWGL